MEFEGILPKTMSGQFLDIPRNINDVDGIKGALLDTNTAANTKYFRDITYLGSRHNFNTYFFSLIDRTIFFTLLLTSLWLALLRIHDGDSMLVIHFV